MNRTRFRMCGRGPIVGALLATGFTLSACQDTSQLDWDLRGSDTFSTADAARTVTVTRPEPDARGVIAYPGYRVAVARPGDTVRGIAQRVGVDPQALAQQNALNLETALRGGETLVLPGAGSTGETGIAMTSLDSPATGGAPIRHQVQRGETAFTIARLYNVSSRALADWNGLGADMEVREGQTLVIPVAGANDEPSDRMAALPQQTDAQPTAAAPGRGSPTPPPPSASQPLPSSDPAPAGQTAATPAQPPVADMQADRTEGARLAMPVDGRIIRAYARGRNDGIGIGAAAGTPVRAAANGTVAAITRDTDQVPIMVVRHDGNLLTVYANIDDIRVERGATVRRGQTIATVRTGDPSFLHFEVREGFESVDPMPFLQ
ncbi:LysM peptidoglycan-binding domain-containing protein [Pararhodobacter sp. SW119]|uniref:LysM peptidoglycan-binding domain-containing protein n=1 Tax=Pararhodobacter sp. SW119 TaxID=2780075 RepID=UPI001FD8022E|nr:LysM peptidoglycan-binding domain-containing protein [Pararhodobacter sp. SW119]